MATAYSWHQELALWQQLSLLIHSLPSVATAYLCINSFPFFVATVYPVHQLGNSLPFAWRAYSVAITYPLHQQRTFASEDYHLQQQLTFSSNSLPFLATAFPLWQQLTFTNSLHCSIHRVPVVFVSFWKIICHFQGLEDLWKINNSAEFFESLWIFTSVNIKLTNQWFPDGLWE